MFARLYTLSVSLAVLLVAEPAYAAGLFGPIGQKLNAMAAEAEALATPATAAGLAWAVLCILGKVGGASIAVGVLITGICLGNIRAIAEFFTN